MKKLPDSDFPYQVFLQHRDSIPVGGTCLMLRKWLFSTTLEAELLEDEVVCDLIYQQAVSDLNKGLIDNESDSTNLRMLKAQGNKTEVIESTPLPSVFFCSIVFKSNHEFARLQLFRVPSL